MEIKKIKIRVMSLEESSKEAIEVAREIDKGIFKKRTPAISFENFEVYLRTFTQKRMNLLKIIGSKKPKTISELTNITKRNFKNIHSDIKILKTYGLIKLEKSNLGLMPIALYDEVDIDIKIPLTA